MTDSTFPPAAGARVSAEAGDGDLGRKMHHLLAELFPICRSITGEGVRTTLQILQASLPLEIHDVPSGTQVFDWTIPAEWNIRDAYVLAPSGEKIIDFQQSNLHVVNYSQPVRLQLPLAQLQSHLHSMPEHPQWIPYRTSYYTPSWGFCLSHQQRMALATGEYEVVVDAEHKPDGSLTYGELFLPGSSSDEVLFSCHVCHPSLANDNLSSVVVASQLAQTIAARPHRYSYRFVFVPGTIGSIAWLARNRDKWSRIRHGLVLALLGDSQPITYKRSRRGNSRIDKLAAYALAQSGDRYSILDFAPVGYDERQYASPGINLPVGRLSRSVEGGYAEYHSSADDLDLVTPKQLLDSLNKLRAIVDCIEEDRVYRSRAPFGEPQLGRRGLYGEIDGRQLTSEMQQAISWTLNLSDGACGLFEISQQSGLDIAAVRQAAEILVQRDLLSPCESRADDDAHDQVAESAHPSNPSPPSQAALELSRRAHAVIPGGCHTYAKGDDQFPINAPRFFTRGAGCRVFDSDGNEFIEYGMGLRSVALGHAFPSVIEAATRQMQLGSNFTRPSTLELEVAEDLLSLLPAADMVKFAKNGSDATTAAVRLARAFTGREKIAMCADQPFFSVDDWFISRTPMSAGIPRTVAEQNVHFPYNDLAALERVTREHRGQIACLIMEAAAYEEPAPGYLQAVQQLCRREGIVFVLDEMITGFRWHLGGAQAEYDVQPDLSTFGKALGNGFSVAALAGRQEIMRLGGLDHDQPRVFLLSYTHGAETHCLAAAQATLRVYREQPVIDSMYRQGDKLRVGLAQIACELGIQEHFFVIGRSCNLVYATLDAQGNRSQAMRTLLLQELIRRGIFAPSLVVSYSHQDCDIDRTLAAFGEALSIYQQALADGPERFLQGRPSQPVFRKFNESFH